MTDEEAQHLRRENAYLKSRCAQLQDDVSALDAELIRLRSRLEHATVQRARPIAPNPLSGGQ